MASKLYIGNLDKQITVDELAKAFDDRDVQIEKEGIHLKQGFAFIDCPEEVVVDEAVEKLADLTINEKNVTVEKAQDRRSSSQTRIVIKNVPESVSEESLTSTLESYGEIKNINKHDNLYLVTYSTSEEAQAAKESLHVIDGQSLQVEFATRKSRPTFQNQPQKPDCPLKLLIPHVYVGAIIGRGGATIRTITQKSNARVDVVRRDNLLHDEKVVVIVGNETSNCIEACNEILSVMHQEENASKGELKPELKMLAPNELCGRLIGKHGSIIKSIMSDTETHITVSASPNIGPANCERVVNIRGQSLEGVVSATEKVYSKLKSCIEENMNNMRFMNPSNNVMYQHGAMLPTYQQWSTPIRQQPFMNTNPYANMQPSQNNMGGHMTVYLYIPKTSVGAVIGSKGSFINYVKQDSRASCQIQERKDDVESVDRPVKITGYQDGVWRACFHIFNKIKTEGFIQTDHDPISAELIVPKAAVGRIIGKAGQNVRQIQEVTQCSVKLPEKQNQEEEEVPVLINGPFYYVILAQSLIRHLLLYGQLPPRSLPAPPMYRGGANYIRPQRSPYHHAANNIPNHDHGDH